VCRGVGLVMMGVIEMSELSEMRDFRLRNQDRRSCDEELSSDVLSWIISKVGKVDDDEALAEARCACEITGVTRALSRSWQGLWCMYVCEGGIGRIIGCA
jgi:hypothetical protein